MQENQEVFASPDNVGIEIAEPAILNRCDRAAPLSIQIGPVHECNRITDLARVCWCDDAGAVILPLGWRAGDDSIRGEIHGCWHPEPSALRHQHLTAQELAFALPQVALEYAGRELE